MYDCSCIEIAGAKKPARSHSLAANVIAFAVMRAICSRNIDHQYRWLIACIHVDH